MADDCNYLLFCSVVGPFWKCKSGKYMIKEELLLIVGDEEGLLRCMLRGRACWRTGLGENDLGTGATS